MKFDITGWLRQPTTINGIGALVGTAAGVLAHVLTHDTTITAGAGAVAFAAVHLVFPDNSAAPRAMEKLMTDAVSAAAQNKIEAALPQIVSDGLGVLSALAKPAAKTLGMIALIALVGLLGFGLAACSPTQQAAAQKTVIGLCKIDQQLQPVVVMVAQAGAPVVAAAGAPAAAAAGGALTALDQTAVHPAIVAACNKLGGTAVVSAPSASSPPGQPVAPAPAAASAAKAS